MPRTRVGRPTLPTALSLPSPFLIYVTSPYTLHLQNGQLDGKNRLTDAISSGTTAMNGIAWERRGHGTAYRVDNHGQRHYQ